MRLLLATLAFAGALFAGCADVALAKPRPSLADEFNGDRYAARRVAQGANSVEIGEAVRCSPLAACGRKRVKPRKHRNKKLVPPGSVAPLTLAAGFQREVGNGIVAIAGGYLGGNPTGWRSRWCGNFMRLVVRKAGLPDNPGGNLARNWSRYGQASGPHVGAIGVMRSHVGIVIGRCPDGRVRLRSGNHGRRVGDGCYAASRFIAFRVAS